MAALTADTDDFAKSIDNSAKEAKQTVDNVLSNFEELKKVVLQLKN